MRITQSSEAAHREVLSQPATQRILEFRGRKLAPPRIPFTAQAIPSRSFTMKRNALNVLLAVAVLGFASSSFADESQPELQPNRIEFNSFKFPVGATSYVAAPRSADAKREDYRFLADYSPN
jgi:hypothetical protein